MVMSYFHIFLRCEVCDYLETWTNSVLCVKGFESVVRYYLDNMLSTGWKSIRDCEYSVVYLFHPVPLQAVPHCVVLFVYWQICSRSFCLSA